MGNFSGTLTELQSIITEYGLTGEWTVIPTGHKFTSDKGGVLSWYPGTKYLLVQGKSEGKKAIEDLVQNIMNLNSNEGKVRPAVVIPIPEQKPTVFIVYGHDEQSREQLELILTKLDIEHFILGKSSGNGQTIIETLEEHIGQNGSASIGVVLLTPDDMGYSKKQGETAASGRARQNVILEMGMLIAHLGRSKTIILVKEGVDRPSDTDGIIYLPYESHVKETVVKLVDRLEEAGCKIDHKIARKLG